MRDLFIFNNLKRKKELFQTQVKGEVTFYSCGPTTYNFAHVGNARAFIVSDLIYRVLKSFGYKVKFARNFTDVDDKIITAAKSRGIDPKDHAEEFVQECLKDMNELGMLPPTYTPKVTENIPQIIEMIEQIIAAGMGYVVDGEVLYNVPLKNDYGKLSKKDLESLEHGIRVEVEGHKKHPADFVLWKPAKAGEVSWNSPWGAGRPGWHIECSAMAKRYLGLTIDLHHGGVDLMFPHHENEIAQSESANECTFCSQWVHNEFVNFGSEKMSKSLGNVVTIRDFTDKYSGIILRMIAVSVHYRAKLDWTDDVIERALSDCQRIHQFIVEVADLKAKIDVSMIKETELIKEIQLLKENFLNELANDFNSAAALSHYFNFIRLIRRSVAAKISHYLFEEIDSFNKLADQSIGIFHQDPVLFLNRIEQIKKNRIGSTVEVEKIEELIEQRKEAKMKKDWSLADGLRDQLKKLGIVIKDNPDGTTSWVYSDH